ncbi:MAG TPA: GtrA family protein [Patescibacteria group bacterium]|jgi:putative flippase GtrA|nr:GtrA family protein [Patescibacteria group bacterium]
MRIKGQIRFARADLIQFIEYFIGGSSYFWSGYITFAIFYSAFGWNWLFAKMVSDVVGWTINYLVQRYWAFNSPGLSRREGVTAGKYALLTVFNLSLDYLIIWSLKQIGISPYIGFFLSAGFFTVWNYLWYRFWVFHTKKRAHINKGEKL